MLCGSEEHIEQYFPDNSKLLINEMYENQDIFLNENGIWELREDFISGDIWEKIDTIQEVLNNETDEKKKDKQQYGIKELENAIGWVSIEDIIITPQLSWIPEDIINDWIKDTDGVNRKDLVEDAKLTKNEDGKWGIKYNNQKSIAGKTWRDDYKHFVKDTWYELSDEIVYYLNMQKQRSINIDTEIYKREHDEYFKNYVANHSKYRNDIETRYNKIFNTQIKIPVKTYPVHLKGWQANKTLRSHQWQSIHHLYRQGKGISALGTGFGKTLSAIGLNTLLSQERKKNKTWLQVPNNKVKDWVKEIKDVLPDLKIGYIDPEDKGYSSREKRFSMYQNLANGQYDIIIMPESSASEIQLRPENDLKISEEIIALQMSDYALKTSRAKEEKKEHIARSLKNGKTNTTIYFEDFGCDAIIVDEGHEYKNLFTSSLSRETGLNDGRQAAKALSLFKKTEYIRKQNDGKNVFFLTATPLVNSPLEYYNMLMYIAPEELKKLGINKIDDFIKNFAIIEEDYKYDWSTAQLSKGKVLKDSNLTRYIF